MRYTYVKQHYVTDCAAACLAMVCLHYRKDTTITKLQDMMGADLKGTNLIGLSKCADEIGFTTQVSRVNKEGILSKYTLPAIANVITKEGLTHFVVIFKITEEYVILGDPAKDLIRLQFDEFYKDFAGVILILKPNQNFVTNIKGGKKVFRLYLQLFLPQKKLYIFAILATVILTVLAIVSSLFNKILLDEILPYKLKNNLLLVLTICVILAITQMLIGFLRYWVVMYLSKKINIPLMQGYFQHIYKLPMKFFSTRKMGDIITGISDAFTIKENFTNMVLILIMDMVMAIITGVILFNMNITLFVIILFMTIISVFLVFILKQPYQKLHEEQMQHSSILNSQIIEGLRGVETIKGNVYEETEFEYIEREYLNSSETCLKKRKYSNIQGSISSLNSTVVYLFLMYFGVIQIVNNVLTLGSLMAFMTLSGYFMDSVGRLVSLQLQIQKANISLKRISEILDYEREQNNDLCKKYKELEKVEGDIEIKNLTFRYGNRKPVLENVSFTIPQGKKVALVGESGSGKSTIAKLLLKYYEPEYGEITIDGIDISEYSNQSLRKAISYVPQSIELFSKSIYDNIRVSKMDATLEEVKAAAIAADAHSFIKKLPMQYYTYLEEYGNGLSGGEKQRIALARAFLKRNEFYILDESTSNLDFATENIIFDMIYNKFKKKSMLIIAHRLSTIKNCDLIIVLKNGEIIEKGTHEELLEKRGQYYLLWEMQQGNFVIRK